MLLTESVKMPPEKFGQLAIAVAGQPDLPGPAVRLDYVITGLYLDGCVVFFHRIFWTKSVFGSIMLHRNIFK
jgi:hypothetical protein